jgi:hypothetical protein
MYCGVKSVGVPVVVEYVEAQENVEVVDVLTKLLVEVALEVEPVLEVVLPVLEVVVPA